jgi:hypothetical protein
MHLHLHTQLLAMLDGPERKHLVLRTVGKALAVEWKYNVEQTESFLDELRYGIESCWVSILKMELAEVTLVEVPASNEDVFAAPVQQSTT